MEFLKEILGEELFAQVSEKINAYNGDAANKDKQIELANLGLGEYVSKSEYDDLSGQLAGKQTEIDTANNLIAQLKKGTKNDEALQNRIGEYETEVSELRAENARLKLDNALKFALKDAGALDVDYLVYKAKEKGEIKLDDKGNIQGCDELLNSLKTQSPTQFKTEGNTKIDPIRLPKGPSGSDKAPQSLAEALEMQYEDK